MDELQRLESLISDLFIDDSDRQTARTISETFQPASSVGSLMRTAFDTDENDEKSGESNQQSHRGSKDHSDANEDNEDDVDEDATMTENDLMQTSFDPTTVDMDDNEPSDTEEGGKENQEEKEICQDCCRNRCLQQFSANELESIMSSTTKMNRLQRQTALFYIISANYRRKENRGNKRVCLAAIGGSGSGSENSSPHSTYTLFSKTVCRKVIYVITIAKDPMTKIHQLCPSGSTRNSGRKFVDDRCNKKEI